MTDDALPPTPALPPADDKDWTWVLGTPCPDCGFDAAAVTGPQVAAMVRGTAGQWRDALAGPDVRVRPAPQVWSVLEYAAHCRDVYAVFTGRVELMLTLDDPQFANWDQDATAVEKRYWDSDPAVVSVEIGAAGEAAAVAFESVRDDQWERTGRRSNGSTFTVESLGQYFLHDLIHHLHDVNRPLPGHWPAGSR